MKLHNVILLGFALCLACASLVASADPKPTLVGTHEPRSNSSVVVAASAIVAPPKASANQAQVQALVKAMTQAAPVDRIAYVMPGWEESPKERLERYKRIAEDALEVASDTNEPQLHQGKLGRFRTAAALLGVALHESTFHHDIDAGDCYRKGKHKGRCDYGAAVCVMQIHADVKRTGALLMGFTRKQIQTDRKTCFRVALRLLSGSQGSCQKAGLPPTAQWAQYARGACVPSGVKVAQELHLYAQRMAERAESSLRESEKLLQAQPVARKAPTDLGG